VFSAFIDDTGKLGALISDPTDYDQELKTSTSTITQQQWTFTAVAHSMDNGAFSATCNFKINDAADEISSSTSSGIYHIDIVNPTQLLGYVGTTRGTSATDFTN
jgi:hypothetical protein